MISSDNSPQIYLHRGLFSTFNSTCSIFTMKVDWRAILIPVALWGLVVHVQAVPYSIYADDLQGSYCATRPKGCCPGRQDSCSAPILDTLCYCDDFCNRTSNDDCCPDFWSHCKGMSKPIPAPEEMRACYYAGKYYNHGEKLKVNCKECKCQDMNGFMDILCDAQECIVEEELISQINENRPLYGWRASNYSEFWGKRLDEGLAKRLGTLHSKKKVLQMRPLKTPYNPELIPSTFDARRHWPGLITPPMDQTGNCAASWAVSTAAVVSDRFSVLTRKPHRLSPQHLLSCNNRNQQGCNGGHLTRAWFFIRKFGLVPESCYAWVGAQTECRVPKKRLEQVSSCPESRDVHISQTALFRTGPLYKLGSEKDIMYDIMTSGPVQATMKVSREFFLYREGIYHCSLTPSSKRTGYHAVRIIGWGKELNSNYEEEKFWIVANSWGKSWGEDGYFRIRRGTNECEIEALVIAAWATSSDVNNLINSGKYDIETIVNEIKHRTSNVRNDIMK